MKNRPKISIIMPAYNRAYIISRAIKSVLKQTYKNFELIIVDDGSNDNLSEVVAKFNDERIRLLKKEHSGLSKSKNFGIRNSKGNLVTYLDTDDILKPKFLEEMNKVLTDKKVWLVYCDQTSLLIGSKRGKEVILAKKIKKAIFYPQDYKENCLLNPNQMVHRKFIFKKIGYFDEDLEYSEDWELFSKFFARFPQRAKYLKKNLSVYYDYLKQSGKETITNSKIVTDENKKNFYKFKTPPNITNKAVEKIREITRKNFEI